MTNKKIINKFSDWWRKPPTKEDKKQGFIIGLIGGFWLTLILLLFLLKDISFLNLLLSSFAGAMICSILGRTFPKIIKIILYPFSMFNIY